MQWKITVKPSSADLGDWRYVAERDDGETAASGSGFDSYEDARAAALLRVDEAESEFLIVEENTTTENYTPSEAAIAEAME